jgi:hypothetical protein
MPDKRDDEPSLTEGEPAFLLEEGVPYVRAWATAQHAATAMRDALDSLGHADAMPYLHADVNVFGQGMVELGRVTPETAALIANALQKVKRVHNPEVTRDAAERHRAAC